MIPEEDYDKSVLTLLREQALEAQTQAVLAKIRHEEMMAAVRSEVQCLHSIAESLKSLVQIYRSRQ